MFGEIRKFIKTIDAFYIHSMVVLVLTNIGSVLNLMFHVAMGHWLSKAQYGIMSSLLGIFLIFSTPFMSLQNTIAHYTSHFLHSGDRRAVYTIVHIWLRRLAVFFFCFIVCAFLFRNQLAGYLNLGGSGLILLVVLLVSVSAFAPVYIGVLQGRQWFVRMCVAANIWAVVRLLVGCIIVYFWFATAAAALSAHLMGIFFSLFFAWFFVQQGHKLKPGTVPAKHAGKAMLGNESYFFLSIGVLLAFSVLMNGDVIFVKAYFKNSNDYGTYSRASTIARTLIFLSQPIVNALFPKVVTRGAPTREHTIMLLRCIGMTGLLVGAAMGMCLIWPQLPLLVLYGESAPPSYDVLLVRLVALAMVPTGITQILISYEMAQKRFSILIPLVVCALAMVTGYALFHQNLIHSIAVLACCSYAAAFFVGAQTIIPLLKTFNRSR